MAILMIREYKELARGREGATLEAGLEPGTDQTKAIGGTSAKSNAFAATTNFVRLHTDIACTVKFGSDPTALVKGAGGAGRMVAGQTEMFGVIGTDKVAVILDP